MRDRSNTWISLATRGDFEMESVAVINGVEYASITAPVIDRSLFSSEALSVGNCVSASVDFTVMTTNSIPKSAQVIIKGRITDGTTYSEWQNFGTFWINKRTSDDDLTTLECFDAMMKANQAYVDDTEANSRIGWPKSMQLCVNEIAQRIGVQIDSRTTIKTTAPYVVPYPQKLTMLQVLGYIGGCHGGNWIITPDNKLRLVPLVSPPADSFDIVDYDYNRIKTEEGYKLVWQHIQTQEVVTQRAGGGLIHVPVVTGYITTARQYSISRVTMTVDSELGYTAGDSTGYELEINDNPYSCQAICDDLVSELSGIIYAPFNISGACYDPMAELGDWIIVGDKVRGVLCAEATTFDINFRVEASAPGEDELNSEYPYLTEIQKLHNEDERLQKYTDEAKREVHSTIEQTRTSILLEVSETYATQESQTTAITLVNGQITAEVTRATTAEGSLSSRITQNADSITSEVTRATTAEGSLSSRITQNADSITSEVTRATTAEGSLSSRITQNADAIDLRVEKSGVIAAINLSTESSGGSTIKISADKVNLSGYATFTNLSTSGQTSINGANIQTGTITATQLSSGVNSSIANAANGANSREQLVYISKASGTTSVSANTTWVTNSTGNQNTWTTKRPQYSSNYPVLFIAKQSQTVAQKNAGTTCDCTTPVIDQTTTVIDGGNIITGTITAGSIAAGTITGDKIAAGTITAAKINSTDLHVKGANIDDTLSASKIYGGTLTLGGSNNGKGTLVVKDSSDNQIGTWNNGGITLNKGNIEFDTSSQILCKYTSDGSSYLKLNGDSNASNNYMKAYGLRMKVNGAYAELSAYSKDHSSTGPINLEWLDYIPTFRLKGTCEGSLSLNEEYTMTLTPSRMRMRNSTSSSTLLDIYCGHTVTSGDITYEDPLLTWNGRISCNNMTSQSLNVTGSKSRIVSTEQYSNRLLYCYETPTPMFGDVGEGVISDDGYCYVWFDAIFAQTICTEQYQIFLQQYSAGECYVSRRTNDYFVVVGTPGLVFGWEVKAKQRDYDQLRLEKSTTDFTMPVQQYGADAAKYLEAIRKERAIA